MPELPEVRTVAKTLKKSLIGKKVVKLDVIYPKIIDNGSLSLDELLGKTLVDITTRGKYLIFKFDNIYLVSHLRMEGKFFIKNKNESIEKHEHVIIEFDDNISLRYHDTRKFGRMFVTDELNKYSSLNKLGYEVFDKEINSDYLLDKFKNKNITIKEGLLDQSIIAGLGNIYANEVLFACRINPYKKCRDITKKEAKDIIENSASILEKAISYGGTTIKSYTPSLGVIGQYQDFLKVHKKEGEQCLICHEKIVKTKIGGRSTYYCQICQKEIKDVDMLGNY